MVKMFEKYRSIAAKTLVAMLAIVMVFVAGVINPVDTYAADKAKADAKEENAQQILDTLEKSTTKLYVIDAADILTTSEEAELTELCKKTSKNCETDIVIITMRTGKDYSTFDNYIRDIIETYYGYAGTGTNSDAIVYGIDMVSRADRIVTSGNARSDISQSNLDDIRVNAEEELSDGDYYQGCRKFVKGVEKQMNNSFLYEFTLYLPIKLLIAAIIALVSVLVMMHSAKSHMTVDSNTYVGNDYKVHRQEDRFINTTVRTRKIESSSGGRSGGGGGGGNSGSSGGHF